LNPELTAIVAHQQSMRVPPANIGRHLGSEPNTPSLVVEVDDHLVVAHAVIIPAGPERLDRLLTSGGNRRQVRRVMARLTPEESVDLSEWNGDRAAADHVHARCILRSYVSPPKRVVDISATK
jgi:hypothetical protein